MSEYHEAFPWLLGATGPAPDEAFQMAEPDFEEDEMPRGKHYAEARRARCGTKDSLVPDDNRLPPAALGRWYDGMRLTEKCRCGCDVGTHSERTSACVLCAECDAFRPVN